MEIRVSDLNQNISGVLAEAQNEDIVILKHGKPVAVLVGHAAYQALTQRTTSASHFETAYDFFKTLPGVDSFEVEREMFELRNLDL